MPADPNLFDVEIEDGLTDLWTSFAISANARSIPDVRDGLKPVARRCLYTVSRTAPPNGTMKKCARLVGEVLGHFHPHGEKSIYDAMVRLSREWELPLPMFDTQGNFGAIDGSEAAAMRYTEMRLSQGVKDLCLAGIEEDAVPFQPNYDGQEREPVLLPVSFPLLLVNGIPPGSIGVGYASAFPVHHPAEVCNATIAYIRSEEEDEDALLDEIMGHLPGPDFPTGGSCSSPEAIQESYRTGKGTLRSRASCDLEEEYSRIVFTSVPVGVSTMQLTRSIVDKARRGKGQEPVLPEIRDVRDETWKDRNTKEVHVRISVDVRRGEDLDTVLRKLYRHTIAESSFHVGAVVRLPDGRESVIGLLDMIDEWITFRMDCIVRIESFRYEKASDRIHVLDGLLKALDRIDDVISFIRHSKGDEEARGKLAREFGLTDRQAKAVLQLPLGHLSRLRMDDLHKERGIRSAEAEASYILMTDEGKVMDKIVHDLEEVAKRYSYPRKTSITRFDSGETDIDMIEPRNHMLVLTKRGHLIGHDFDDFQAQHKGTRGKRDRSRMKTQDAVIRTAPAHSHDRLLMFLTSGDAVRTDVYRAARRGSHESGIGVRDGERISAFVSLPREVVKGRKLLMVGEDGTVRLINMRDFLESRYSRLAAFSGKGDLSLSCVVPIDQGSDVFLISQEGKGVRFPMKEFRVKGRKSMGIKGMRMSTPSDRLAFAVEIPNESAGHLLFVTRMGFGKRVEAKEFKRQGRGTMGVAACRLREGDHLACVEMVDGKDEILVLTRKGIVNRIRVDEVRPLGRLTLGSRLQKVDKGDEVVAVSRVPRDTS